VQRRSGTRGLGAVLFTDIVGSTVIAAEMGNTRWAELLTRHHQIVRRELRRFGGRENDTAGDGFFATFERPVDAIRCAVAAAAAVRPLGIEIRAGVSFGQLELVDGKAGGLIVNTAARVLSVAGPGEVLVPASVRDIVSGAGISFADHGTHRLKGLEEETRLFLVTGLDGEPVPSPLEAEEAAERRREIFPVARSRRGIVIVAGIAAVALAAAVIALHISSRDGSVGRAPASSQFLVELDPENGDVLQRIDLELPRRPGQTTPTGRSVAAGQGAVWVLTPTDPAPTLLHVDPSHGDVREPMGLPFSFSMSVVSAFESVWVAIDDRLMRVNPATDDIHEVLRIQMPGGGIGRTSLSVDRSHVWLARTDGILMRFDRSGDISRQRKVVASADLVAGGEGSVWVVDQLAGILTRVDPDTLEAIADVPVSGNIGRVVVAGDYVVVLDRSTGVMTRISVGDTRSVRQVTVGEASDMVFGFGAIWVSHPDGTISRVNPSTLEVTPGFARVQGAATAIAVDVARESVWVDVVA
jgi:class 3 adenylate cyclase